MDENKEIFYGVSFLICGVLGGLVRATKDRETSFKGILSRVIIGMFVSFLAGELCMYYELAERLSIIISCAAGLSSTELIGILMKAMSDKCELITNAMKNIKKQ